jgi:hypothetical protein
LHRAFHITIGSAPAYGLSLEGDLRLVKSALLYADQVKLCSVVSSMVITMSLLMETDQKRYFEILEKLLPAMAQDKAQGQQIAEMVRSYRSIGYHRNATKHELQLRAKIQPMLAHLRNQLNDNIKRLLVEAGIRSLNHAVQTGLLQLHTFRASDTWDNDSLVEEYVEILQDTLSSGATYPLFDDQTGNLVRTGLQEGRISVSQAGISRGKHSGLAARLFERLPLFDEASVSEILDIRLELEKPLTRFRSAMITFSDGIRTAAWDEDFSFEAEQVFQRDVQPAILDLEEAVKTNKYLLSVLRKVADKPLTIPSASALGILMSKLSSLPDIASQAFGLGAASGLLAYDAYKDWLNDKRKIEDNQLYFYYKAGTLLSDH